MTLQLPTFRAAENFSRALDGTADPAVADRYAELVETVSALRATPPPSPRPEFVASLREQLMTAADSELTPAVPAGPRAGATRHRERRLAAVAAAVVLVGTTAGVATAAEQALPGSTLYPVKRGIESAQLSMTTNETAKGREFLSQANTRLDEVVALLDGSDSTTEQLASTLDAFNDRAAKGSDLLFRAYQRDARPADISTVRSFAAASMITLDRVVELAPPTSSSDFSESATLLAEIDQQARTLCDDCSAAGALTAPASLVTPRSADALTRLISGPTKEVSLARQAALLREQISANAKQAEAAAGQTPPAGSPEGSTGASGPTGSTPPHAPTTVSPDGTPLKSVVTSDQPIKTIVDNVTSGLPEPIKKVTDTVTEPLTPLTNQLDQTLKGLTSP